MRPFPGRYGRTWTLPPSIGSCGYAFDELTGFAGL
jgi:hypothetical protein